MNGLLFCGEATISSGVLRPQIGFDAQIGRVGQSDLQQLLGVQHLTARAVGVLIRRHAERLLAFEETLAEGFDELPAVLILLAQRAQTVMTTPHGRRARDMYCGVSGAVAVAIEIIRVRPRRR